MPMQFMDDPLHNTATHCSQVNVMDGSKKLGFFGSYRIIITAVHNIANIFMMLHASVIS